MNIKNLETERMILMPVTYKMTRALAEGSTEEVEKLGIRTMGKWPRQDTLDILPFVNQAFEEHAESTGFEFWMIVLKENRTVIGDIGFKGTPDPEGTVEIGYGILEEEHRKGYGFEALKAMLEWAFSNDQVKCVKADCLIDNLPSIRILQKAGMREVGRDSELIYWEISK